MPTRRVTIREVAQAAGVSRQTVTRAINDMADISEETRQRVMKTVEELGYRPNRFAIELSRQRTLSVGLIIGTFRNPYYAQLADAFVNELQRRDWQLVVGTSERGEAEVIGSMASQVDAIVGYIDQSEDEIAATFRGMPIIRLEHRATTAGVHSVELDWRRGVTDLVTALRAKGARRFGMIDASPATPDPLGTPRRRYFEDAVSEQCTVVTEIQSIAGGADGIRKLLAQDPRIDTVLAFNDLMAMGAVQGAHTLGVDVPGAIRIVGIDGLSLGEAVSPQLTSLSLDSAAVAREAADILAQLFAGHAGTSGSIARAVTPVVVWRESA
ncbi:LacI family DNA-binding transcriptional regulator [Actinoplanes sichuanensis]|uniref:LacI family DNA-binding transcriptional regulator n=1 Tax=Actinoplanes sichuanensis TaxID=512349 RepID=A0ABW4AUG0_9ACTN|nr:LacI family DNA-binding transcriptional regulator [Actinoplanes sichuanensis]BEL04448.1 LacI family DNA-binding transcriptional regulator [Actinoplanes sichuanensis]